MIGVPTFKVSCHLIGVPKFKVRCHMDGVPTFKVPHIPPINPL